MPKYITAENVRRATGAPSDLISDAYIEQAIDLVEKEVERWLNTAFTPTLRIDFLNGLGRDIIFVKKNPLLSVRYLKIQNTEITLDKIHIHKPSGQIQLSSKAETSTFISGTKNVIVKYLYGMVIDSDSTSTTSDVSAGTSITIPVSDSTIFTPNDWVRIIGIDGYEDYAQIISIPDSTNIVVDNLTFSHDSGSLVYKQECPEPIKRYMEIEAGINIAVYAIGGTYDFNTSYSLGELSVNKGEPYPQWREVIQRLITERNMRRETIKPRPFITM